MGLSVNTNAGAMIALQHLNATNTDMEQTQLRLTTGRKVNGPKDDAATFSIAQRMRGDIAGMGAVRTALAAGEAAVDVAIEAAQAMSDLLLEMKAKVVQANQAGLDSASRTALDNEFSALAAQIDEIGTSAEFNGVNLVRSNLTAVANYPTHAVPSTGGWTGTIIPSSELAIGNILEFSATGTVSYSLDPGADATADGPVDGTIAHLDSTLVPDETVHSLVGRVGTTSVSDTSGFAIGSSSTEIVETSGNLYLGFNDTAVNAGRTGYDLGQLADNSGLFNIAITISSVDGLGVLSTTDGDTLDVAGHYLTSSSLGLDRVDLTSAGGAKNALKEIGKAINTVNNALTKLGASAKRLEVQSDFTAKLMDNLTAGLGNLVDADMAAESAALQAGQIKQQLGTQALSIANASPQSILSLFGN